MYNPSFAVPPQGAPMPGFTRPTQTQTPTPTPGVPIPMPEFMYRNPRIDASTHAFMQPRKQITSQADIETFVRSEAMARFMTWLMRLNDAVRNRRVRDVTADGGGEMVHKVLAMLDELRRWTEEIPPNESAQQRYGNTAFRTWHERLHSRCDEMLLGLLPAIHSKAVIELKAYWLNAFGNATRIDYGTGHELNFAAFLCCLSLLRLFSDQDDPVIVLIIFNKYLSVVRTLQRTYRLEPAGSHGVWGLDDYQFLPYLFGASQLYDHARMRPKAILNAEVLASFQHDYLFFDAIQFIHEMKTGPFHEHSPMLYDISAVPTWQKVNKGLIKMFVAEVLSKVPVVQHFEFGTLLPWKPAGSD